MHVTVKGETTPVHLTKNDFLASGGEGEIYARKGIAYKIYTNPKSVIPFAKIEELSVLQKTNIIKPEKIIFDKKRKIIGYTMKHICSTYALCQLFPRAFRDRTGLDISSVLNLVQRMRQTISHVHKYGILIVDLNEMNFLVDKNFSEIYFIDVDSWQTPSFPATAIMESIRDRHNSKFSELTDWFSFGIISFEMFIGIHPFKGKHPTLKTLDDRMRANIPVFHKDVKFPKVCLPFDVIPQAYKDWYVSLFFNGKRLPPPLSAIETVVIQIEPIQIMGNEDLEISEIFEYDSDIIKYISLEGVRIATTKTSIYIGHDKTIYKNSQNIHISVLFTDDQIIIGRIQNNKLDLENITSNNRLHYDIDAEDAMSYGGRIYIKNKDQIHEIEFVKMGDNLHAIPHLTAMVLEKATQIFDGVIIQNMLGRYVISLFPYSKTHYQISCPEMQGYKIIDAKYDNKVLIIIGVKSGKYDRFIFKFNKNYSKYSIRKIENITYSGINYVVLDNGIVVLMVEDEKMEIFSNNIDNENIKVLENPLVSGDMILFKDGVRVLFSRKNKLYNMKMKNKNKN